jgi:hypothetical protein
MKQDEALAIVRGRNQYEVTLSSGHRYIIGLPSLKRCVLAGGIPMPIVEEWAAQASPNGKAAKRTPDEDRERALHMLRYQEEVVRSTIRGIDGELLEDEVSVEFVRALEESDFDELFAYGSRARPVPTAASVPT